MKPFTRVWLLARRALWAVLASVVLVLAFAYGSQWLLCWRAQRLMDEMHRIRLYQTDWAEAQNLMHEWGAWGHYEGTCTASDCRYEITLGVPFFGASEPGAVERWLDRGRYELSRIVPGIPLSELRVRFIVHQGTILRYSAMVVVDVPAKPGNEPDEYSLIVIAKSEDRLHSSPDDPWILGSDAQLAEHPYYKVGRLSGCMNCMAAHITFSTHAPPSEIDELVAFDFSCFIRWHPCRWLGDVLPIAREWRLYGGAGEPAEPIAPAPPRPCDISLWALGRDFNTVFVVEALQTEHQHNESGSYDMNRVHIFDVLKGASWRNGLALDVIPFQPQIDWRDDGVVESMVPGKRYLLLWDDWHDDPLSPAVSLSRCGVQPDTPQAREELRKGFLQNDGLRVGDW